MTKLNFSLGMLLIGSAFLAGGFSACSSKDNGDAHGRLGHDRHGRYDRHVGDDGHGRYVQHVYGSRRDEG